MFVHICVGVPQRLGQGIRSPGAGVTGSDEPPDVVLRKSSVLLPAELFLQPGTQDLMEPPWPSTFCASKLSFEYLTSCLHLPSVRIKVHATMDDYGTVLS